MSSRCRSSMHASGIRIVPPDRALDPAGRSADDRRAQSAAVSVGNKKVTLVDYSLVPDIAVVDPTLTSSMPRRSPPTPGSTRSPTRWRQLCSIFASPYTDTFCTSGQPDPRRAPRAYHDGSDLKARSAMANAATWLAFSNAFVRLNTILAHAVSTGFGIAHGRADAIFQSPRPALQRVAADRVHARAGYSAYVAPRTVRADCLDPRNRR